MKRQAKEEKHARVQAYREKKVLEREVLVWLRLPVVSAKFHAQFALLCEVLSFAFLHMNEGWQRLLT